MQARNDHCPGFLRLGFGWLCLLASLCFFRHYLTAAAVAHRATIPPEQTSRREGLAAGWRIPAEMRAKRWHRTGVRVYEDGQPLAWRVREKSAVLTEGRGRFCLEDEWLWFSASDGGNPSTNGRRYELEVLWPGATSLALGAGLLAMACLNFLSCRGRIRTLYGWAQKGFRRGESSAGAQKKAGFILLLLAGLVFTQSHERLRLYWMARLPPELVFLTPEGSYFYPYPRWIHAKDFRVRQVVLLENGRELKRVEDDITPANTTPGSYASVYDRVTFLASDASNPSLNGRPYQLRIPLISRPGARYLAVLLAAAGVLLAFQAKHLRSSAAMLVNAPAAMALHRGPWGWVVLALGLLKLVAVSGEEIMAAEADSNAYADMSIRMVWGTGAYQMNSHPPGLPLVAGVVRTLGLPWRMALEMLYLGAGFFLVVSLQPVLRCRAVLVGLFGLLAWHPWTWAGFNEFMTEPLLLVIFVGLLALAFRLLARPVRQWTWGPLSLMGLFLAVWNCSRHEDPLVYASFILFAVCALILERGRGGWTREVLIRSAAFLILPLQMAFVSGATVDMLNYHYLGIPSRSLINSPGLMAVLKALYRVQPEQALPFAPVTRQSLQAACQASPTLRRYEKSLLDSASFPVRMGERITRTPGEFGPFIHWLLPQSLPYDRRKADDLMFKAAAEIDAAVRSGQLPGRSAHFPLDPQWRQSLPRLWPAFAHWMGEAMYMRSDQKAWGTFQDPGLQHLFDEAVNRRSAHAHHRLLLAHGNVQGPAGAIDSAALVDHRGQLMGASLLFTNAWDGARVFDIRLQLLEWPSNCHLAFYRDGQQRYSVALTNMIATTADRWGGLFYRGRDIEGVGSLTTAFALPEAGGKLECQMRLTQVEEANKVFREKVEAGWGAFYQVVLALMLLIVVLLCFRTSALDPERVKTGLACLALAMGWIVLRSAFYALVEANLGWGPARFARCVSPLFVVVVVLLAASVGAGVRAALDWIKDSRHAPDGRANVS